MKLDTMASTVSPMESLYKHLNLNLGRFRIFLSGGGSEFATLPTRPPAVVHRIAILVYTLYVRGSQPNLTVKLNP
jgi:hypothetical protein